MLDRSAAGSAAASSRCDVCTASSASSSSRSSSSASPRGRRRDGRRSRRAAARAGGRRPPVRALGPAACSPRCPAITARSSATRATIRSVSSSALLGGRAERRQPPGEQPARWTLGLEQRAQREQVVGQRLVALSRSQPSSKRRSAQASSLSCGARRETRLQKARSSSSCSAVTTSIPCGRPPVAERERTSTAPSPTRAQASAPSVTRPSPNRRSAAQQVLAAPRVRARAHRAGRRRSLGP